MVMSTTIRVNNSTRDRLAALASESNQPMNAVVDEALTALERQRFFDAFNAGYDALRADADAWANITAERDLEAATLRDGHE